MIKLICISDKENKGMTNRVLKKISDTEEYDDVSGEAAEEIIKRESADFLYLDIKRPANIDDMNRLCLRNIIRLRVSVFRLKPIKSQILKFFFPPDLIITLAQNILLKNKSLSIKEYKDLYSH